jgi:hypothetical protein
MGICGLSCHYLDVQELSLNRFSTCMHCVTEKISVADILLIMGTFQLRLLKRLQGVQKRREN